MNLETCSTPAASALTVSVRPAVRTHEEEAGIRLSVALPGVRKEDLKLSVQEGILHLEAPRAGSSVIYRLSSRLSQRLDGDKIEAKLENGVLDALVPLRAEAQVRTIPIA